MQFTLRFLMQFLHISTAQSTMAHSNLNNPSRYGTMNLNFSRPRAFDELDEFDFDVGIDNPTMKVLLWSLFGGIVSTALWGTIGVVCCCFIIFIPQGLHCLKIARLAWLPFGSTLIRRKGGYCTLFIIISVHEIWGLCTGSDKWSILDVFCLTNCTKS